MGAEHELVEEVDADGRVLRIVTRAEVRAKRLRHRCTYVLVINRRNEVVVHQRADWKDVYPSWWDLSFGGLCDPGEAWDDAANRELAEEAGLTDVELTAVGPMTYDSEDGAVVGRVYLARTDAELTCPDGEVVALDRILVDDINSWMAGRDVCLDSKTVVWPLVHRHLKNS